MLSNNSRALIVRWLKFNAVGWAGTVVQLATLTVLVKTAGMNYLVATAVAVECAILHNFIWHERVTWSDRASSSWRITAFRLIRFNVTVGAISIVGNVLLMRALAGGLGMHYLIANLTTIILLSLANFAASHLFVFQKPRPRDVRF